MSAIAPMNETTPGMPLVDVPGGHLYVAAALFFFSMAVGGTMNVLVLTTFRVKKNLRSPTNLFIIAISAFDLALSVFATPVSFSSALSHRLIAGLKGCIYEGFMVYWLSLTDIYLLTAMAVDRYIVITKPLWTAKITNRVVYMAILGANIISLIWSSLPFVGFGEFGREGSGVSCGVKFIAGTPTSNAYVWCMFVFVLFLPLAVMAFCYINIWRTIKHMASNNLWDKNSSVAKRNMKVEAKMVKTCVAVLSVFFAVWLPYAVLGLWAAAGGSTTIPAYFTVYPPVIAKLYVAINPLVYFFSNRQFRQGLAETFPCCSFCVGAPEELEAGTEMSQTRAGESTAPVTAVAPAAS